MGKERKPDGANDIKPNLVTVKGIFSQHLILPYLPPLSVERGYSYSHLLFMSTRKRSNIIVVCQLLRQFLVSLYLPSASPCEAAKERENSEWHLHIISIPRSENVESSRVIFANQLWLETGECDQVLFILVDAEFFVFVLMSSVKAA